MATYNYSFQSFDKTTMARSHGVGLAISLKKTVETAKAIQGKKLTTVFHYLEDVLDMKRAIPYRRFNAEMGHKRGKGIASGGYPIHVIKEVIKLIESAKKNAESQEISGDLYLISVSCRKGNSKYHYGRYSGRQMKSTTVEVVVGVKSNKKQSKEASKKWLREK